MTEHSEQEKGSGGSSPQEGIEPPVERRAEVREGLERRVAEIFGQLRRLEPRDSKNEHAARMAKAFEALKILEDAVGAPVAEPAQPEKKGIAPVEAAVAPAGPELESLPSSERLARLANKGLLMRDPAGVKRELDAIRSGIDPSWVDSETAEHLSYVSKRLDRLLELEEGRRETPAGDAELYLRKAAKGIRAAEEAHSVSLEKMNEFLRQKPKENDRVEQAFLDPEEALRTFEQEYQANKPLLGLIGPEMMTRMRENTARLDNIRGLLNSIRFQSDLELRLETARKIGEILLQYQEIWKSNSQ